MAAGLALDRSRIREPVKAARKIEYKRPPLAKYQEDAIFCHHRYGIIEASTKAGKTTGCLMWLMEEAMFLGKPGRNFWWVAPVFTQADIAYTRMQNAIPRNLYKSNDTDHTITLVNGAVIWFKSADRPDSLYGEDVYAAVVDEASRTKMETWIAIRSTLTFTKGRVRIIGNVKGRKNWAFKMARRAEAEDGQGNMKFTRITAMDAVAAGILDKAEIEDARSQMSEEEFNELYLAIAPGDESAIYTAFSDENITGQADDQPGEPLLIGLDFNVDPMVAILAVNAGGHLHIFKEIVRKNSTTTDMCKYIRSLYPKREIVVYPDPSGKRRSTTAKTVGETDFSIIRDHRMRISAPSRSMNVVDRINCVNAAFLNAAGHRRVFVNPRVKGLIRALEEHEYKEGTKDPDKKTGLDHYNDAAGYLISRRFPIRQFKSGEQELEF